MSLVNSVITNPTDAQKDDKELQGPIQAREEYRVTEENEFVRIIEFGKRHASPSWNYVISHGLGGTKVDDRFHRLAIEIRRNFPTANVFLVDWSQVAAKKNMFGLPSVRKVSAQIKKCGELANCLLNEIGIDPKRTTFIGESFGSYVNYEIANRMKKVARILCFNAAVKLGGYSVTDMSVAAKDCYSFQTVSIFDTRQQLCQHDIRLELAVGMKAVKGHTYGIRWLLETLKRSDRSWILCRRNVPTATDVAFSGTAFPNGQFEPRRVSRRKDKRSASAAFLPRPLALKSSLV